jgi:hypothetical protein
MTTLAASALNRVGLRLRPSGVPMSLVDHARRELKLCGQFDEDPAYAQALVAAVAAFASYGHSGGSAGCGIDQLTTLLRYGTLSPLTDDPDQWHEVGTQDDKPLYQSARRPEAFSVDGGESYYLLSDRDRGVERIYPSESTKRLAAAREVSTGGGAAGQACLGGLGSAVAVAGELAGAAEGSAPA